jgi:membrane protein YdbS with pleckstrin-like domain
VKKCHACGTEVDDKALFCQQCGTKFAGEPAAAAGDSTAAATAARLRPEGTAASHEEHDLWQGTISARAMYVVWLNLGLFTVAVLAFAIWLQTHQYSFGWWGLAPVAIAWLYYVAVYYYRRFSVRYRLTTRRFFHEQGLLRRRIDCIQVIEIEDIDFEQGLWDRLLGLGTIHLRSKDITHPRLVLFGIENAKDLFALMDRARQDEQIRRGLRLETV